MAKPAPSPKQLQKSTAILEAARHHYATHGFEATKLSDVASDAGVAVGTIYLRYESKEDLLAGALAEVENSLCNAMNHDAIRAKPFPERFSHIISNVLAAAQAQPDLPQLMALASFAPDTVANAPSPTIEQIAAHIRDGMQRSELRKGIDLRLAAHMAHGMVEGAMRDLMAAPARRPDDIVVHIADAYARWLLGDQRDKTQGSANAANQT